MAKSSDRMNNAVLALTTFADRLHRIAKHEAQQLDALMRELRLAVQDEQNRYGELRDKYEATKGDVRDLNKALRRLERGSTEFKDRERKERDDKATRDEHDEERRARKSRHRSQRGKDDHRRRDSRASSRRSRSRTPSQERRREDRRLDSYRPEADEASSRKRKHRRTPSNTDHREDGRIDSYRPNAEESSPRKRKHRRSSSKSSLVSNPFSTTRPIRFPNRKPVYGSCRKHGSASTCNGGVTCTTCKSVDKLVCCYYLCPKGDDCERETCTYLHSEQWDIEVEKGARKVNKSDGTKVSGYGDEYLGVLK